jgi:hypothetical protein
VYWPQECHRLRLTSLAPHLGQIQTAGNAGELVGGSIESTSCETDTVAATTTRTKCRPPETGL